MSDGVPHLQGDAAAAAGEGVASEAEDVEGSYYDAAMKEARLVPST